MRACSWMPRLAVLLLAAFAGISSAQTLRFGLAEDPDVLDPTLARTFVGRVVFAALCDKLFDIDEKLNIVPQLATGYEWSADSKSLTIKVRPGVTFHDGEKLDAAAVKYNIERHKTMPGSNRRGELAPVASVDVVDPMTVRLNLSAPFAPLLAQLADRAGMMVSPKAAQAAGDKFGVKPVCSGPFRFVERVAQDRIVLERYPNYWNKGNDLPRQDRSTRRSSMRRCVWPTSSRDSSTSSSAWRPPTSPVSRAIRASTSPRSPRSATRASPSTSARATSRRRIRWARTHACARLSSWRSTAKASSRW